MRIEEIDETLTAYRACRFDHTCALCPIAMMADYGDCSDILDDKVIKALERLKYLEMNESKKK